MALCSSSGGGGHRFLFEVIPDLFPQPFLSELERALWERHYEEREEARKRMKKHGRFAA
jgi:hypothetical protein